MARLRATPLARRLARERKLNLAHFAGSGPRGRIIAADLEPRPAPRAATIENRPIAALRVDLSLKQVDQMLTRFRAAGLTIEFEDVAIRALAAALSEGGGSGGARAAVHVELPGGTVEVVGAATMALSAIHTLRMEGARSEPSGAMGVSLAVLGPGGLVPVSAPPLPGFDMRVLISPDAGETSATLFFDEARVPIALASAILSALRQRLEEPSLLLL